MNNTRNRWRSSPGRWVLAIASGGPAMLAAPSPAQFSADFEPPLYTGAAAGLPLEGQEAWYRPFTNDRDVSVYEYAGNSLGISPHPMGGSQFAGAGGTGPLGFSRAQQDIDFEGADTWTMTADVAVRFEGSLPAGQNIGSVSTQPGFTSARMILLASWVDQRTATSWNAGISCSTASGSRFSGPVPDPAFQDLKVNHWYRWSATFNFSTNRIEQLRLTDLATGATASHHPEGLYLEGGAGGGLPRPTAIRLWVGSPEEIMAFDNVRVEPHLGCYADCDGNGRLDFFDFLCFQDAFLRQLPYADCDANLRLDFFDFLCFQNEFLAGCP